MSKGLAPAQLAEALQRELIIYAEGVQDRVNDAGKTAADKLLRLTKSTAPKDSGAFVKSLAVKETTSGATGIKTYIWGAKPPHHRLTHLLVHGHATRNGGRVKGDPFLSRALDEVLPEYEKAVREAVKSK